MLEPEQELELECSSITWEWILPKITECNCLYAENSFLEVPCCTVQSKDVSDLRVIPTLSIVFCLSDERQSD